MSIRKKTLLIVACVMVFIVFIVLPVNLLLLLRNMHWLERDEVEKALERSRSSLDHQLQQLAKVTRDWAFWDDTYEYLRTRNRAYEESNLVPTTFLNLGIDLFLLLDLEGRPVIAIEVDRESGDPRPPAQGFLSFLANAGLQDGSADGKAGFSGVVVVEGLPYLLSVMPVLPSTEEGPPRGKLAMARHIDEENITWMERATGAKVDIFPVKSGFIAPEAEGEVAELLLGKRTAFRTEGLSLIHGYCILDSRGESALVLEVTLSRDVFRSALYSSLLLFGTLLGSSLLVIFGTYVLVSALFIKPMERMTEALRTGFSETSFRVLLGKREDELATLAEALDRAFQERTRSERRLKAILENSQDVIALFSEAGEFLYASPSSLRVLGYREEDLLGRNVYDFIHPDDRPAARRLARAVMESPESPATADLRFRHPDGSWVILEIKGNGFLHDPHLRGILVTAHDISERVRTQRMLESINSLLLGFGPDLMDNIYSILRACREMMGGEKALYLRRVKEGYAVLSADEGDSGLSFLKEEAEIPWLHRLETAEHPVVLVDPSGEWREDPFLQGYSRAAGIPVSSRDKVVGCLLLLDRGTSAWKEGELRALVVLAKALAVEEELLGWEEGIKEFMDIASHELRHPITLMKGYALTLLNHYDRMDEATRREMLKVINQGADRLETLVSELLDLTRIERGRFTLQRKRVDPRSLLARAVREMGDRVPSRRFLLTIQGDLSLRRLDEEKILQVLVILMDNAVKYSDGNAPVEVAARDLPEGLEVSVLDRGPGIPEDKRELVFHRFYQVEQVLHHSKPGLGLGLYIAREIVEAHGGRIWNEPREGGGTVFRFLLP